MEAVYTDSECQVWSPYDAFMLSSHCTLAKMECRRLLTGAAATATSRELSCTELRAPLVIGIFTSRRSVRRWCVVVVVTYHFVNVLLTLMCSGQVG